MSTAANTRKSVIFFVTKRKKKQQLLETLQTGSCFVCLVKSWKVSRKRKTGLILKPRIPIQNYGNDPDCPLFSSLYNEGTNNVNPKRLWKMFPQSLSNHRQTMWFTSRHHGHQLDTFNGSVLPLQGPSLFYGGMVIFHTIQCKWLPAGPSAGGATHVAEPHSKHKHSGKGLNLGESIGPVGHHTL